MSDTRKHATSPCFHTQVTNPASRLSIGRQRPAMATRSRSFIVNVRSAGSMM